MEPPVNAKAALLQELIRREGYALDLIKRVSERTKGRVKLHQGNVYPALRNLEEDGLLKSWEADPTPERGGRHRRYYKITDAGKMAALQQTRAVAGLFGLVLEFLGLRGLGHER